MEGPTRSEFLHVYQDLCAENGTRYLDIIPNRLFRDDDPVESVNLQLEGNQLDLFEHRLVSGDVSVVAKTLLKVVLDVKEIDLSYNLLEDEALNELSLLLDEDSYQIVRLNLAYNSVSPVGAAAFVGNLELNTSLRELCLDGNEIGPKAGMAIADMLASNNTLASLSIANTEQNVESIVAIASALRHNTALHKLNLSNPRLHSGAQEAISHISLMLRDNSALTDLNLSKFQLRCHAAKTLSFHLSTNNSITSLDLSCNRIAQDGAAALSELLRKTSSIKRLILHSNRCRTAGAFALGSAFTVNATLEFIDLRRNGIEDEGLAVLGKASLKSSSVKTLWLWGNRFGSICGRFFHQLVTQVEGRKLNLDFIPYIADNESRVQFALKGT